MKFSEEVIGKRIDSIRGKLDFLDAVSEQLKQFKQTFADQLKLNESLNLEVKDKMDRMFSMFTKLKSDFYIKIEALGQDQLKTANKVK